MKLSLRICSPQLNSGFRSGRHMHIHLPTCHTIRILLVPEAKTWKKSLEMKEIWRRENEGYYPWDLSFGNVISHQVPLFPPLQLQIQGINLCYQGHSHKLKDQGKKGSLNSRDYCKIYAKKLIFNFRNAGDQCHCCEMPEGAIFVL